MCIYITVYIAKSLVKLFTYRMELEDDYRSGPDIEPDSDVDDAESESQLSQWLGELENYAKVRFA